MLKMQMAAQNEKRKNASGRNKGVTAVCAFLALIYSGILCFFFYKKWDDALQMQEDGKYQCVIEIKAKNNPSTTQQMDYAEVWIMWMQNGFIVYLLLSIMACLSIVGAAVTMLRVCAGCCSCCVGVYHTVVLIGLTVVRFNKFGIYCTENTGADATATISPQLKEDGEFLSNVIIWIWILTCLHNCCLNAGMSPS